MKFKHEGKYADDTNQGLFAIYFDMFCKEFDESGVRDKNIGILDETGSQCISPWSKFNWTVIYD